MPQLLLSETLAVPAEVKLEIANRVVKVSGPRGTLTRSFRHIRNLDLRMAGNKKKTIIAEMWFGKRKSVAAVRTVLAHIKNMMTGVTKGFEYKLRFVYAHFPINCSINEDKTEIKINNFLGEKMGRPVKMLSGVSIARSEKVKDEVVISGNNIESVSQSAAVLHQCAKVPGGKDIRKFLDGIYVSESHVIGEN